MVSSITANIPKGSQISPANERAYHQSNLIGDWKGTTKQTNQPVELKVDSINGGTAQVEYTHNGHTERGTATVDKNTLTYGNLEIATNDGKQAAYVYSYTAQGQLASTGKQTAVLTKNTPASTNPLVGSWTGATDTFSASFQVTAINGRDATVKYNVNGVSGQGTGDIVGNSVLFGKVAFQLTDGVNGKLTFQNGKQTLALPVNKFTAKTA